MAFDRCRRFEVDALGIGFKARAVVGDVRSAEEPPIAVRDGCAVHLKGCRGDGCVIGRPSLSRQSNAREGDLGLGRNAKSRSVPCRQPAWEMLQVFRIAGVIVGGVGDQHGNLDNAIEPTACGVEGLRDKSQRIPNLFGGGIAPIDPAAGIVRSRRSRHEYKASGFGGPAERTARARFRQAYEVDHEFDSF